MPYEQHPGPATALNVVARTETSAPLLLANTIARQIRERHPDVPVRVSTMEDTVATSSATPRFRALLLMAFASVALVLTVAGVYSVLAFTVSRRVPEIGVRIALGATPERVLALVLREGAILTCAGLLVGLALFSAASRIIQGLLFGVTPRDPVVRGHVTAVVALAALVACLVPAIRALRVDPTAALRSE
jgi:ABC-type antimicrobial peptide transport system permease subunit